MVERNHIDVVNECIVNVLIAHPFISQEVKDAILHDGARMADFYSNKRDQEISIGDIEGLFGQTLEKQSTFEARRQRFQHSVNRYGETNALTRRFLARLNERTLESDMGLAPDFTSADEYDVVVSAKRDKLVPLMMNLIKGFNARPTPQDFFLSADCEAIISFCEANRRVLVVNEPVFLYKERQHQVQEPRVFTSESWAQYVQLNKYKVAVYMLYPTDAGVEITYALV